MIIYGSLEMKSVRKRFASCRAFRAAVAIETLCQTLRRNPICNRMILKCKCQS